MCRQRPSRLPPTYARVSYTADWFDGIGRNVADDDYGGDATAPDPPSATKPAPQASIRGGDASVVHGLRCRREDYLDTDAAGRQALTDFDNEGRVKDTIQNYSASTGPGWNIENSTVYGDGDNLAYTYVTTTNATGGGTTTEYTAYVYGTMLGDSCPGIRRTISYGPKSPAFPQTTFPARYPT